MYGGPKTGECRLHCLTRSTSLQPKLTQYRHTPRGRNGRRPGAAGGFRLGIIVPLVLPGERTGSHKQTAASSWGSSRPEERMQCQVCAILSVVHCFSSCVKPLPPSRGLGSARQAATRHDLAQWPLRTVLTRHERNSELKPSFFNFKWFVTKVAQIEPGAFPCWCCVRDSEVVAARGHRPPHKGSTLIQIALNCTRRECDILIVTRTASWPAWSPTFSSEQSFELTVSFLVIVGQDGGTSATPLNGEKKAYVQTLNCARMVEICRGRIRLSHDLMVCRCFCVKRRVPR